MKEGFVLRKGKGYPLLREERKEVHKFISEQLKKEYIRPLKSSQMALVFFVGKNGKKRIVQNYRYLNEWTVKNYYSLPLISDIVENIGMKKVFTKMDLQWVSRSLTVDSILFSLFIFILLFFSFLFHFSIFRTTRVRVDQSCCHISH